MLSSMKIEALGSRKRNSSAMRRLKNAPWREIVLFWSHCKTWFIGEKSGKKKKKRVGYLYFRLCFSSCVYFHEINTHCIRIPVSFVGCCVLFFFFGGGRTEPFILFALFNTLKELPPRTQAKWKWEEEKRWYIVQVRGKQKGCTLRREKVRLKPLRHRKHYVVTPAKWDKLNNSCNLIWKEETWNAPHAA